MKKLMVVFAILISANAFADRGNNSPPLKRVDIKPGEEVFIPLNEQALVRCSAGGDLGCNRDEDCKNDEFCQNKSCISVPVLNSALSCKLLTRELLPKGGKRNRVQLILTTIFKSGESADTDLAETNILQYKGDDSFSVDEGEYMKICNNQKSSIRRFSGRELLMDFICMPSKYECVSRDRNFVSTAEVKLLKIVQTPAGTVRIEAMDTFSKEGDSFDQQQRMTQLMNQCETARVEILLQ